MGRCLDLYLDRSEPLSRAVELTARNLGIEFNLISVDILAGGEEFPEALLALNPQRQLPLLLDDSGFYLGESVAIMQYLCNAYAKDDKLYPKLTKKRALVDSRLIFNMGTLFRSFADAYYPAIFQDLPLDPAKLAGVDKNLGYLEGFLQKLKYVAGDGATIADFAIVATLATIVASGHPSLDSYSIVVGYLERCKSEFKGYEENEEGAGIFGQLVKAKIGKEIF